MDPTNPYRSPQSDLAAAAGADTTHPLDPSGRFTRLSWFAWNMILGLAVLLLVLALMAAGLVAMPDTGSAAAPAMSLGVLAMDVAFVVLGVLLAIRRLHDMNASGWWAALLIAPLVNVIVLLVLAFTRGSEGANRFGPPRPTRGWEKVLGILYIVLIAAGFVGGILVAIAIPAYMDYMQAASGTP